MGYTYKITGHDVNIDLRSVVDSSGNTGSICVDFWVQPGHVPPIIEKRPCIYHFTTFSPNIFEKSTPLTGSKVIPVVKKLRTYVMGTRPKYFLFHLTFIFIIYSASAVLFICMQRDDAFVSPFSRKTKLALTIIFFSMFTF